jgi:tetratricopeptide (TPR) repeat protein
MPRKKMLLLAVLLAGASALLSAESAGAPPAASSAPLSEGIAAFGAGQYRQALDSFGKAFSGSAQAAERAEASYWSALAYIGLGDRAAAMKEIDAFLAAYPENPRVADLLYQRGRLLYAASNYEVALRTFAGFIETAPNHDLVSSALYWGGECLYSLGRLDEADKVFATLIEKYPSSVKLEAASYRRKLISLESREQELLRLLTLSHEESLYVAEDFRRRERTYEQALAVYQKQTADSKRGASSREATAAELKARVDELSAKLQASEAELAKARAALASSGQPQAPVAVPSPVPLAEDERGLMAGALASKARALDLLAFYLEHLPKEAGK